MEEQASGLKVCGGLCGVDPGVLLECPQTPVRAVSGPPLSPQDRAGLLQSAPEVTRFFLSKGVECGSPGRDTTLRGGQPQGSGAGLGLGGGVRSAP